MYRPGDSINITTTIKNVGNFSSSDYNVDYFATDDSTTSLLIGSLERDGLEPGEEDTFETLCQFPVNIPPDYYSIEVVITCQNDIDENNNYKESSISVLVSTMEDLAVELVDVNNVIYMPGDQINVYTLIKNVGDKPSAAYTVNFYASGDMTITNQDLCIGTVTVTD